jgi:hypothetical protein
MELLRNGQDKTDATYPVVVPPRISRIAIVALAASAASRNRPRASVYVVL